MRKEGDVQATPSRLTGLVRALGLCGNVLLLLPQLQDHLVQLLGCPPHRLAHLQEIRNDEAGWGGVRVHTGSAAMSRSSCPCGCPPHCLTDLQAK